MSATAISRLADADRLDQHHVVAGRLHQHDRLPGGPGHAAQRAGARRGPDEARSGRPPGGPCGSCRPGSSPPVRVEEGSTASTATRCPAAVSFVPSASMNVDLPDAGHAADADPVRAAGARAAARTSSSCAGRSVVGPAGLHQRDGPGQHRAVAGEHALRVGVERASRRRGASSASWRRVRACPAGRTAASAITVPGPKMAAAPASCSAGRVLRAGSPRRPRS